MTAALEGGEWSAARAGRTLPLGKTRYPLYRRLGGPQGRSGWTDQQRFTRPKYRVPRKSGKILFVMKQTLQKNNLSFVKDVAMCVCVCVNLIIIVVEVAGKIIKGISFVTPLVPN